MNKLLITGCLLVTAFAAVAMPTKKELAAAQKLVEDVIAPDVKALNAGRKTVKDVADIQMKLAADAQSEAEKYLLLQSAFKLYSRGEEFDSAAKALTAITRDIKDVPPELITELVDKEFNRDMGLKAPKEIEVAVSRIADSAPKVFDAKATVDGYTWSYRVSNGEAEIVAEKDGKFLCAVSPSPKGDVTIPSTLGGVSVTRIGQAAFKGCKGMVSVTIPSDVKSIGGWAFEGCSGLTSMAIPDGVKTIEGCTFWCCGGLKSVLIPSSVTTISDAAFGYCGGLTSMTIPPTVRELRTQVFFGCGRLKSVTIPASVEKIGWAAFVYSGELKEVNVDPQNKWFTSVDGALYTKDLTELVACPNALTTLTIQPSVRKLRDAAIISCGKLESLTIPEGVTDIGWQAIKDCVSLKSVTIPSTVRNIASIAFCNCRSLTSVTIPENVVSIGERAFDSCVELASVTMLGECPNSPDNLFLKCAKLKEIHVPANAKSWAGMTEWQGVSLVFDEEAKGLSEMTPGEREFKIGAVPGTVVEVDIGGCPLQFVSCPAGKFRMGYSEKPEVAACREIEISSPFWMTKGRLTMEQLRALGAQEGVTENKEGFACVNEASLMVEKLPKLLNKRFEGRIPEGYVFRLPTEAEFEYVQKAGAVGNDPRLAWGYSDDTDSVPNPWGIQKLFYAGRKDCFLDRVGGGKDVVSRFARNTHWTDLVSINYENQPSRDPVGWCEGNRWAVLRRVRNNKLTGSCLYGSTFYFVLAPDESRLNKFIWK